jgi:hypothetical protein
MIMAITTGANLPVVADTDLEKARQKYIAKSGRPSSFSLDIAAEILVRLESGEPLQSICRDDHLPGVSTVYDWKAHIPAFAEAYARARRNSATSLANGGLSILDDLDEKKDAEGNPVPVSMVTVRLAEMRARYRFELSKCFDRDTFGDKRQVTAEVNHVHTVGSILDLVMLNPQPMVIEAEEEEIPLLAISPI